MTDTPSDQDDVQGYGLSLADVNGNVDVDDTDDVKGHGVVLNNVNEGTPTTPMTTSRSGNSGGSASTQMPTTAVAVYRRSARTGRIVPDNRSGRLCCGWLSGTPTGGCRLGGSLLVRRAAGIADVDLPCSAAVAGAEVSQACAHRRGHRASR